MAKDLTPLTSYALVLILMCLTVMKKRQGSALYHIGLQGLPEYSLLQKDGI